MYKKLKAPTCKYPHYLIPDCTLKMTQSSDIRKNPRFSDLAYLHSPYRLIYQETRPEFQALLDYLSMPQKLNYVASRLRRKTVRLSVKLLDLQYRWNDKSQDELINTWVKQVSKMSIFRAWMGALQFDSFVSVTRATDQTQCEHNVNIIRDRFEATGYQTPEASYEASFSETDGKCSITFIPSKGVEKTGTTPERGFTSLSTLNQLFRRMCLNKDGWHTSQGLVRFSLTMRGRIDAASKDFSEHNNRNTEGQTVCERAETMAEKAATFLVYETVSGRCPSSSILIPGVKNEGEHREVLKCFWSKMASYGMRGMSHNESYKPETETSTFDV